MHSQATCLFSSFCPKVFFPSPFPSPPLPLLLPPSPSLRSPPLPSLLHPSHPQLKIDIFSGSSSYSSFLPINDQGMRIRGLKVFWLYDQMAKKWKQIAGKIMHGLTCWQIPDISFMGPAVTGKLLLPSAFICGIVISRVSCLHLSCTQSLKEMLRLKNFGKKYCLIYFL